MKKRSLLLTAILVVCAGVAYGQGLNIPNKHWGISFGNSTRFTGLRFNIIEKNIERIDGVNLSVWHGGDRDGMTGKFRGVGLGLPLASGTADRGGLSVGLFGVAASNDIRGVNLAGLAVGAGSNLAGINMAGLAVGAGGKVKGLNASLLVVGAGNDLWGINVAGLVVGAGNGLSGLNFGGLVAGSGEDMTGVNLSLLVVGCGEDMTGISVGGLVAGCGDKMTGVSAAILFAGAPRVRGGQVALVAGGADVKGIVLAPAYYKVKGDNARTAGLNISAFNHVSGFQTGLAIGIFNYAHDIKGLQLGVINHVRNNPKWLRWLPLFNTRF